MFLRTLSTCAHVARILIFTSLIENHGWRLIGELRQMNLTVLSILKTEFCHFAQTHLRLLMTCDGTP